MVLVAGAVYVRAGGTLPGGLGGNVASIMAASNSLSPPPPPLQVARREEGTIVSQTHPNMITKDSTIQPDLCVCMYAGLYSTL